MVEAYGILKAHILYQAILDYTLAKMKLEGLRGKSIRPYEHKGTWERRLKECEDFFNDPPYDYGDVDTSRLIRLCDSAVRGDRRIIWEEH